MASSSTGSVAGSQLADRKGLEGNVMLLDHHVCVLFDRVEEISLPKLQRARKASEYWIFVSDGETAPAAGAAVDFLQPDITIDTASLGMRELPISVKDVVRRLRELADNTRAKKRKSPVFFLDMAWLLRTPSGIAHLGEFEAAWHEQLVTAQVRSICLYNRQCFPESLILDVLRTHPYVVTAHGFHSNPHFLPPQAYLTGDPAAQLISWMDSLGPATSKNWSPLSASDKSDGRPASISTKALVKLPFPVAAVRSRCEAEAPVGAIDPCATQNRWKVRSLGKLRIYRQDGTPIQWDLIHGATVKTKTLFALLLQAGAKGVAAEQITDLLWPDSPSIDLSMNRLYHTVHCLRMALDPNFAPKRGPTLLLHQDRRYYLNLPEGTWVDGHLFEQYCRRGEQLLKDRNLENSLACHQVAEKIYSGPLFSDIPDKYTDNMLYDWCWSRRYWLQEINLKMLTYTARIHRELGNTEQAIVYAEKALNIEPCFEAAHQEALRSFHVLGRRDAIERQYRLCNESLRRFEDRAPSSETRTLFQGLVTV